MVYEWHVLLMSWGLPVFFAVIVARGCWLSIAKPRKSSYEALLEERERLNGCVTHWRYPDGSYVPQHKRQQMFKDMHKLSRQIRNHPDHPGRQGPLRHSA
jgi:hypothetical protein